MFGTLSEAVGIWLTESIGYASCFDSSARRTMEKVTGFTLDVGFEFISIFRFFKNLKVVAVDELHYYSGALGR
jgi:hypothetical protein